MEWLGHEIWKRSDGLVGTAEAFPGHLSQDAIAKVKDNIRL